MIFVFSGFLNTENTAAEFKLHLKTKEIKEIEELIAAYQFGTENDLLPSVWATRARGSRADYHLSVFPAKGRRGREGRVRQI